VYLKQGQLAKASAILLRLRQIEPDFSLQLIRGNSSYPAGTMRQSDLIEQTDIQGF